MWSIGKVTWRMSLLQINHLINSVVQGHSKNNIDSNPTGNSWATANYPREPAVEAYLHWLCFKPILFTA